MKTERREARELAADQAPRSASTDDPDGLTERFAVSVTTGRTMERSRRRNGEGLQRRPRPTQTGKRPAFRKPQLATLVSRPPDGDDWIFETKFDGYRCLAALGKGGPRL